MSNGDAAGSTTCGGLFGLFGLLGKLFFGLVILLIGLNAESISIALDFPG
jgi:hypothetical protein